jgi:RNA polymerase sigma-70 factor (ECF subfamily)
MTDVEVFQSHRPQLFAVAYRLLGSATDAEDVVQDAWLRFAASRPDDLRSPAAYLTTIVTRLCLDRLKSARATREEYVGPWLPEPVVADDAGPERSAALAESVSMAFLVLLETLSAEERAVFILREAFDHAYDDIATMLDTTPANCRQLFHRAKARLAEGRPRFRAEAGLKRPLVARFVSALRDRNTEAIASVLAEDVGFWSDGGGKVLAARRPVFGRDAVAAMFVGFWRVAPTLGVAPEDISMEIVDVNAEPAMVIRVAGQIDSVCALTIDGDLIGAIRVIRNPDKLQFIKRQLAG